MQDKIQNMFDNIARNYDKLNDIISFKMHLKIKEKAIKNIPFKADFKILDLCSGTGDIAIYIAENVTKEGLVIGADFSQKMLEIAEKKRLAKDLHNLKFIKADALNLPFKDDEFDACFISFGLRNLVDLKKGLKEMIRVAKQGGFIINLDTGKPRGVFSLFFNLFFFYLVPILGKIFNNDSGPYKYLPNSTRSFPSPEELAEIFKEFGLKNITKYDFIFGAISQQVGIVNKETCH